MNPDTLTVADFPIGTRVRVRDSAYPSYTRDKVGKVVEPNDSNGERWPLRVRLDEGSLEVFAPRELEIISTTSLNPVDILRRKAAEFRAQANALDAAIAVLEQ